MKKLTENDVIERLSVNNQFIHYVGGFTKAKSKAKFRCEKCGNSFESQAYDVYSGDIGCPVCYKNTNRGISNVISKLHENNPTIEYVSNYVYPHKKAKFRCKKCEHEWEATAYEVYAGNSHCPNCEQYSRLFSDNDIKQLLKNNNNKIKYISGYQGALKKAKFSCIQCGNEWETTAFTVYSGKTGCPKCACSKGENKISQYLNVKHIEYNHQRIFDNCKNIYPLPFDFFLPNKNICIEYDGEYHFYPIIRSKSMTMNDAIINFKKIQKRDKIKTNYCKTNNIELIRIPYTEFNNIEYILDTHLKYAVSI